MQAWEDDGDFEQLVRGEPAIAGRVDLDAVFDLDSSVRHVEAVFERLHALERRKETVHA
jgi:hypothetical protein